VHRWRPRARCISSGAASTPRRWASCSDCQSSIADLLGTLEDAGLVARGVDGSLHEGARWADLSDPDAVAYRVFRACATTDLDGHTISLVQLFGNQIVFVDVRLGRHPLPLTPRPGQRATADACAGAVAILSSLSMPRRRTQWAAASHLGLSGDEVAEPWIAAHAATGSLRIVFNTRRAQLACPVAGTRFALTLHVPSAGPSQPSARRPALNTAADDAELA
jgi:hypothetical protein